MPRLDGWITRGAKLRIAMTSPDSRLCVLDKPKEARFALNEALVCAYTCPNGFRFAERALRKVRNTTEGAWSHLASQVRFLLPFVCVRGMTGGGYRKITAFSSNSRQPSPRFSKTASAAAFITHTFFFLIPVCIFLHN